MNTDFDHQVRAALQQRRGEWGAVALQAGVSHSWISQFVRSKIPNPGYTTLRKLWRVLDGQVSGTADAQASLPSQSAPATPPGGEQHQEASHAD